MKAAVIGYGKSGRAAEKILRMNGYCDISIFDDGLESAPAVADFRDEYDCVVMSPGVDTRKMDPPPADYTSEIELAHTKKSADAPVVAVTGTNGKSTVTTLAAQILKKCGVEAVACGNIGLTYSEAVSGFSFDAYVVELSSFQTGMLKDFSADCVIVTNLAEDHMDRYESLDDYVDDKMNLLNFISEEGRVIILNERYLINKSEFYKGEKVLVSPELRSYPAFSEGRLDFGRFYVNVKNFKLKGNHNLVNLSFALLAVDKLCGLKGDATYLTEDLRGLEHRCEYVDAVKGVEFINDSKGTNVHSTLTAMKGFDRGIVLILGGKDKKGDFESLKDVINEKASAVVGYGDAGDKICTLLSGLVKVPVNKAENLKEAVQKAYRSAELGQKVLLSPACASFDEHKNFEHRGAHFKELVKALKEEEDE